MNFNFDPATVCSCGKIHTTAVEHVTIEVGATGNFTMSNNGSSTVYVSGVEIAYEPAKA